MNLNRWQADVALGFAGAIWGFGFVAQKTALDHVGPFTFVAARFLLAAAVVLPLVFYENAFLRLKTLTEGRRKDLAPILWVCAAFAAAVLIQQYGMQTATVTNTAFLTNLYVVMVPFVGRLLYGHKLSVWSLIAATLSVLGVGLLSAGRSGDFGANFSRGDGFILLCAVGWSLHVSFVGRAMSALRAPYLLSFLQYAGVGLIALALAVLFEKIEGRAILSATWPIVYAGAASGGIAYTLQSIGQQHTPSTDAAIILSDEALCGALGGVLLLGEKIGAIGMFGCGTILAAILLVEIGPLWKKRRARNGAR